MNKTSINNLAKWFNQVGVNFMCECILAEDELEARYLYEIGRYCWLMEGRLNEIAK